MIEPIEYGVAYDFYIPIVKRGVIDFAVSADWTPATGDTKLSKDGGADANTATNPSAVGSATGKWKVPISSAEAQCKQGLITIIDAATKVVEDQSIRFITFGNASAMIKANLNLTNLLVDVKAINGDATAAARHALAASVIYAGTVTGAVTTTTLIDSGLNQSDVDFWKGRVVIPTSGTQKYQGSAITAFDPATDKITFDLMTTAMQAGDTYVII